MEEHRPSLTLWVDEALGAKKAGGIGLVVRGLIIYPEFGTQAPPKYD